MALATEKPDSVQDHRASTIICLLAIAADIVLLAAEFIHWRIRNYGLENLLILALMLVCLVLTGSAFVMAFLTKRDARRRHIVTVLAGVMTAAVLYFVPLSSYYLDTVWLVHRNLYSEFAKELARGKLKQNGDGEIKLSGNYRSLAKDGVARVSGFGKEAEIYFTIAGDA